MTTVTGLTADRMLAIEAASVVDGDVDGSGNLILTKHDGSKINAGSVIGPQGPQGPPGSFLSVLAARSILDVGIVNQIRAGRQLSPADFANIGLSAPLGLWNLSDTSDASGNGRILQNKGAVPFGNGINGIANTSAQFSGSTAQGFYISDTGANDPFRIKTGSWGCWFKTAKLGVDQMLFGKDSTIASNRGWLIYLPGSINNALAMLTANTDGSSANILYGYTNVCDDRWHFGVCTCDGTLMRLYVDGALEDSATANVMAVGSTAPLNVGCRGIDSSTSGSAPSFGRIDEAFVTADILTEDQVRNLYCAKIPHTLATVPSRISLNVRRRRKGAALVASDFPTQPLRLHNFSAGSLGDEGSNNVALINNGGAINVGGSDGIGGNAYRFNAALSQSLYSSDAGLPSGVASRSLGLWFKTTQTGPGYIFTYGSSATPFGIGLQNGGVLITTDGATNINGLPIVSDGQWHFAVMTAENAPLDGSKEKIFLDGRLVGNLSSLASMTLAGVYGIRIGALANGSLAGTSFVTVDADGCFICDYVLTSDQIRALYAKGSQALAPSPKNVGDHVEGMDSNNILAAFDTLESQYQIDLAVAA